MDFQITGGFLLSDDLATLQRTASVYNWEVFATYFHGTGAHSFGDDFNKLKGQAKTMDEVVKRNRS